jgi:hypothetical protein
VGCTNPSNNWFAQAQGFGDTNSVATVHANHVCTQAANKYARPCLNGALVPSRSRVAVVGHWPCRSHIFHTSFRSESFPTTHPRVRLVVSPSTRGTQPHSSTQGVTPLQCQFFLLPPRTFTQVSPPAPPPPHSPLPCAHVFLCVNRAQWPCDLSTSHSQGRSERGPILLWAALTHSHPPTVWSRRPCGVPC